MPFLRLLVVTVTLVTRSALAASPVSPLLPPPALHAEPSALPRAAVDERRPVELVALGRALVPLGALTGAGDHATAAGAGAAMSFRTSPYFSIGAEGSVLRASPAGGAATSFEGAVLGRVYLLESGVLDPYLELAFGYVVERRTGGTPGALVHGPSARTGGGLDLLVLPPLRLGCTAAYREVVEWPAAGCTLGCSARARGGVLAGVTATWLFGDPL